MNAIRNAIKAAIVITPTKSNSTSDGLASPASRDDNYMKTLSLGLGKALFGPNYTNTWEVSWRQYMAYSKMLNRQVWMYTGPRGQVNGDSIALSFYFDDGSTGYVMSGYSITVTKSAGSSKTYEFRDGLNNNKTLRDAIIKHVTALASPASGVYSGGDDVIRERSYYSFVSALGGMMRSCNWGMFTETPKEDPAFKRSYVAAYNPSFKEVNHTFEYAAKFSTGNTDSYPPSTCSLVPFVKDMLKDKKGILTLVAVSQCNILNPHFGAQSIKEAITSKDWGNLKVTSADVRVSSKSIEITLEVKDLKG